MYISECKESGNFAPFGNFAATDTYRLSAGNSTRVETSGQTISEPFNITLLDYYDQVVKYQDLSGSSIVYVLSNDSSRSSIQGQTLVEAVEGYAVFNSLIITYYPEKTLYLQFDLSGVASIFSPVEFRSCIVGEIAEKLSTGNVVCTKCSEGFYSLLVGASKCIACPDNADCPGGNELDLDKGYWRVDEHSDDVLKCPQKIACRGGLDVKDQCRSGHEGKYCSVCQDGYVHSAEGSCSECRSGSFLAVAITVPLVIALIFISFVLVNIYSDRIKTFLNAQILALADKAQEYNVSSFRTKIKIMITFIQILSQMPSVFGALFPDGFLSFMGIFGLFNLNVLNFFSLGCAIKSNYYQELLTATIGPIVLFLLVALGLYIKKLSVMHSFKPYRMAEMRKDLLTASLMISFFIFSPTSITIFQAFTCETFDDGTSKLVADYSIDCESDVHQNYEIYAGLMIIVYPMGIPAYYFYLLVKNHKYVNPSAALVVREDEKRLVDRRIIQAEKTKLRESYTEIQHLSFLYENYAPKRWYFEVLDCFRRLFLTAVPVLILRGTSIQLLLVLLASLIWCIVYMALKPFEMPNDNSIAILSQWAISFTLIGGVMLKVSEGEKNAQYYVIDVLLILINVGVIVTTIYIATTEEDDDILEALAKDARRQKKKYGAGGDGANPDSDDDTVPRQSTDKGGDSAVQTAHVAGRGRGNSNANNKIKSQSGAINDEIHVTNPMYRDSTSRKSDVRPEKPRAPDRRASALGSQLFSTAHMKRAGVANTEATVSTNTADRKGSFTPFQTKLPPDAADAPATQPQPQPQHTSPSRTKRGSVMDKLRGAVGGKKSRHASQANNAGPDSDDDDDPGSPSFSARAGAPAVKSTKNNASAPPRKGGAKNAATDSDDDDDEL